jgi:hypothetical protein
MTGETKGKTSDPMVPIVLRGIFGMVGFAPGTALTRSDSSKKNILYAVWRKLCGQYFY